MESSNFDNTGYKAEGSLAYSVDDNCWLLVVETALWKLEPSMKSRCSLIVTEGPASTLWKLKQ
jgi:hypothetical protein